MTKKITTGILGAGQPNIATNHQIPGTLRSKHFDLRVLCDISPGVFDYAKKYQVQALQSYEEMLADPSVEMIQIATPDWLHCEQAEMAFAAGKHVLLQKPPCLSMEELGRLTQAWRASGKELQVLLNCRETRLCRTIRAAIGAGLIGEVREIRIAYRGHRFPISNPASPYLKAESGGVWLHNGLHWLDEAAFYADSVPAAVQAFATRNAEGAAECLGAGPNYWSSYFMMRNSVTFHFEYNTMLMREGLPGGMRRVVIGTGGEIRQEFAGDDLLLYQPGKEPQSLSFLDCELSPADDVVHSFTRALDRFARRIRNPEGEDGAMLDSLLLMRALLAGAESCETGKPVAVGVAS